MEALGGVSVRCFSVSRGGGPGIDAQSPNNISAPASSSVCAGVGSRKAPRFRRSSVVLGVSSRECFREKDHLDYYYNYSSEGRGRARKTIACGTGACKVVDEGKETEEGKKMKKMLKKMLKTRIQADLPISSDIGENRVKIAEMISDMAEVLQEQLQQLKLEGTGMKVVRRKDSEMMSSSCSSSSESSDSDSERGEGVTDMGLDRNILNHGFQPPIPAEAALVSVSVSENGGTTATHPNHPEQREAEYFPGISDVLGDFADTKINSPDTNMMKSPLVVVTAEVLPSRKKIQVCMGGKCKKSGATALLGEFQRLLGPECAAASGCKCMGRCRDGPNVRILDDDPLGKTTTNFLCSGVGLKDVDLIVENYIAQSPDFGLDVAF